MRLATSRMHVALAFVVLALAACQREPLLAPQVAANASYDVVRVLPNVWVYAATSSPDGAVFLTSTDGELWRGDTTGTWAKLADVPAQYYPLYAPSRDLLFAGINATIFRWTPATGFVQDSTPISQAGVGCGDFWTGERIQALGGRGPTDVFAVGGYGLIAHYDGVRWTLETHPRRTGPASFCYESQQNDLRAVGGNADGVYAAGFGSIVERHSDATWHEVPKPLGSADAMLAIAAQRQAVWFGGARNPRRMSGGGDPSTVSEVPTLYRRFGSAWAKDSPSLSLAGHLNHGSAHLDGPVVFWRYQRQVVVVRGDSVRVYTVRDFPLRGAVPVGNAVYMIGETRTGTVVLRLRE